jgi:hypothetical protein
MTKRRKKHRPDEIVAKLRDADAMLNAGKDLAAVLQALEVSDSTLERWRPGCPGARSFLERRIQHPAATQLAGMSDPCQVRRGVCGFPWSPLFLKPYRLVHEIQPGHGGPAVS